MAPLRQTVRLIRKHLMMANLTTAERIRTSVTIATRTLNRNKVTIPWIRRAEAGQAKVRAETLPQVVNTTPAAVTTQHRSAAMDTTI